MSDWPAGEVWHEGVFSPPKHMLDPRRYFMAGQPGVDEGALPRFKDLCGHTHYTFEAAQRCRQRLERAAARKAS